MLHKVIKVKSPGGLRSKAAALFVQTASRFDSQLTIEKGNKKVNAKSIMGVLSLGIDHGESVHLIANGEDAKQALQTMAELVEGGFCEE